MLPFLISKSKLLQIKKQKPKDKFKDKGFYITSKVKNLKRKPIKAVPLVSIPSCECSLMHVTKIIIKYAPTSRKSVVSSLVLPMPLDISGQKKRKLPNVKISKKFIKRENSLTYDSDDFFKKLEVVLYIFRNQKHIIFQ